MSGMRILIIVIGAIIVLFLAVGLFLPSKAHVERSITINTPVDSVFLMVADFKHYLKWNPLSLYESGAENTISGNPAEVGHCWAWVGDTIGTGKLTIEDIIPGKMIHSSLVFTAPDSYKSEEIWKFEPTSTGIKVTWSNESDLSYPIGRFFGLFLDSMMGSEFEKGLSQLNKYCMNRFQNN
jgi:hypothetical protein